MHLRSVGGIEELQWDTEFFGERIGRATVTDGAPAGIGALAKREGFDCLYVFIPADCLGLIEGFIQFGAILVDIRAELDVERPAAGWECTEGVCQARPTELPDLLEAVESLSEMSRFAADPRFGRDRIRDMYRLWLERCFSEGTVSVPIDDPGRSFVGTRRTGDTERIELVYVEHDRRGSNLGRRLIQGALATTSAARSVVVARAGNIAALRLYQALGFRTRSSETVLHLWLS